MILNAFRDREHSVPHIRDTNTITGNNIPYPAIKMMLQIERASPEALKASVLKRPSMVLSVMPISIPPT